MNSFRRILAATLVAGIIAHTVPAEPAPFVGVASLESWNALTAGLSAFAQSADRPFSLVGLGEAAGRMLQAPNLTGIDVNAPIFLYFLGTENPAVVSVLPVSDGGAAYLQGLRVQFGQVAEQDGLQIFSEPLADIEAERLAVHVGGRQLQVSADPEALRHWLNAAAGDALPVPRTGDATLRLTLDSAVGLPWIAERLQELETRAADAPAGPPAPMQLSFAEQARMLRALAQQLATVSVDFTPEAGHVTLRMQAEAVPGSLADEYFRGQHPPGDRYRGLLPPDALMHYAGGGMAAAERLMKPYLDFMITLMPPEDREPMIAYFESARPLLAQYRGDALSMLLPDAGGRGLVLAQVYAVHDGAEVLRLSGRWAEQIQALYRQSMPALLWQTLPERQRAGSTVHGLTMSLDVTQAPGAHPGLALAGGLLAGLGLEWTVVDNDFLFVFGRLGAIDALIDHLRTEVRDTTGFEKTLKLFPEVDPDAVISVFHFGSVALLRRLTELLPSVAAELRGVMPMPGEGMAMIGQSQENALRMDLRLTASEVRAWTALIAEGPRLAPLLQTGFMQFMIQNPVPPNQP